MFKVDKNLYNSVVTKCGIRCSKNTVLPLVGLCVSYNYMDTLQFMLPINYNHFDKIYLVTQEDDTKTIEFCKGYENVEVLFIDFKNNGKKFDKFGALNIAQKLAYDNYPNHWYLILDSDIILPNNLIDILVKEDLNEECMYGSRRYMVYDTKHLLKDPECYNFHLQHSNVSYILGYFQLYKKKFFHNDYDSAAQGDFDFSSNFNILCQLENIITYHLGPEGCNWKGKTAGFIKNCNIKLEQIYFNCFVVCKNSYNNIKKKYCIKKLANGRNIKHYY